RGRVREGMVVGGAGCPRSQGLRRDAFESAVECDGSRRGVLLGRRERRPAADVSERLAAGRRRQRRAVAVAAEVKLNEMADRAGSRSANNITNRLGCLAIG